jgi:hypothetical protein
MQPRTLDVILAELGSTYDPQVAQIRQRQALIPGQIAEEEKGLQAKQTQSFDDILGGARRRGLGFSGIPLSEQARYTSTEFLPAMARLRQSGREQAMSLEDAILGINERRNVTAQQMRQQDLDRAEQARQFDASQRAAAAQQSSLAGLFGGQSSVNRPQQSAPDQLTQRAYNAVQDLLGTKNNGLIQKTYAAIKDAAGRGSAYDKIKLALIEQLFPTARNFGRNAIPLGPSQPTAVSLNPASSGLSVGMANPSMRLR